jgi:hypothetical protein
LVGRVIADNMAVSDEEWFAACDEALEVLSDALLWELAQTRWEQVLTAIAEIAKAVDSGSLEALWRGIADLELCSPLRVSTRLGDTNPRLPATKPVRELAVELTDKLRPPGRPAADHEPGARWQNTASAGR